MGCNEQIIGPLITHGNLAESRNYRLKTGQWLGDRRFSWCANWVPDPGNGRLLEGTHSDLRQVSRLARLVPHILTSHMTSHIIEQFKYVQGGWHEFVASARCESAV